jgi:hypothetical protein
MKMKKERSSLGKRSWIFFCLLLSSIQCVWNLTADDLVGGPFIRAPVVFNIIASIHHPSECYLLQKQRSGPLLVPYKPWHSLWTYSYAARQAP